MKIQVVPRFSRWSGFALASVLSSSAWSALPPAAEIYKETGVGGGIVVHVGAGTGEETAGLKVSDSYMVQGLETDGAKIAAGRVSLRKKGVYGPVSLTEFDGKTLPFIENFVNLVVAEDLGGVSREEVERVLVPEGVGYFKQDGKWTKIVKPRPSNIDDWTHYFHSASGNAVAQDDVVAPPERLQWVGSPRWSRHHDRMASMSALVSAGGKIFYIMDEGSRVSIQLPSHWKLIARDAFNGTVLWRRDMGEWHSQLWPLKSGPSQLARRLVADGDRLYVTMSINGPVECLDAVTGETLQVFKGTEQAEEIVVENGTVYVLVREGKSELHGYIPKHNTGDQARVRTEFVWNAKPRVIRAYDAASGEKKWEKKDSVAPMTICVAGETLVYHDGDKVVSVNTGSGDENWRTEEAKRRELIAFNFAPRLVIHKDVVLHAGGNNKMSSYDLPTGKRLWESEHDPSGYQSPQDLLVVGGLVWSAPLTSSKHSGVYTGRDPRTGEVKKQFPPTVETYWFHHRCYIAKATENFLMPSRTGIEFIDHEKEHWDINHWVRGGCLYGVMPANGLTYAPPHNCACYPEAKLYGFNALAPASAGFQLPKEISDEGRFEKGSAFGAEVKEIPAGKTDWPTYRGDVARSGSTKQPLDEELGKNWQADLGGRLSALTVVKDRVFVAQIDAHTVHALNAKNGKVAWSYTAGGRVDSPPAYEKGRVIFGSADGWVYCLRAEDGALIWRFRGAPADRRLMAFEQIESVWPVHGTVLIEDGVVSFVVGRSTFLDRGLRFIQLDAVSGKKLVERVFDDIDPETGGDIQDRLKTLQMQVGLNDILSSDGKFTYLRSQKMDKTGKRLEMGPISGNPAEQGGAQQGEGAHLFAPMGFLDDTYFHRAYWVYGRNFAGGHSGYHQAGKFAPGGRMIVHDGEEVYSFGRDPEYLRWTTTMEHSLFAASREIPGAEKAAPGNKGKKPAPAAGVVFPTRDSFDPAGKPVTAEVWVKPDGPGGVILAHGGPLNGYALIIEKKVPSFLVRSDENLGTVRAKKPLTDDWNHVVGVLGSDASMTLYVNGEAVATGKAPGLVAKRPVQPLDVGMDAKGGVGDYQGGFGFTGLVDEMRISFREVDAAEVKANFESPEKARESNEKAKLACSFDTPSGRDESGNENGGTVAGVEVGQGRVGKALWFRKAMQPAKGGPRKKPGPTYHVKRRWGQRVPVFAQAMALAGDTLLVAGPPDIMDEEYTFERIMEGDESVQPILRKQDAALMGKSGGKLLAVSKDDGQQRQQLEFDALPVWDGMAVANGSLFVADKSGRVTRFGGKRTN
jgi:outer membrane protein assembly factor BamB